jgi:hypothetical protein
LAIGLRRENAGERSTEANLANDPSSITKLSTRTVVLLMVFGPLLALIILVGVSYAINPW